MPFPITLTDLNKPEALPPKVPFSYIYFKSSKFHVSILEQLKDDTKFMWRAGRQSYLETELTRDTVIVSIGPLPFSAGRMSAPLIQAPLGFKDFCLLDVYKTGVLLVKHGITN